MCRVDKTSNHRQRQTKVEEKHIIQMRQYFNEYESQLELVNVFVWQFFRRILPSSIKNEKKNRVFGLTLTLTVTSCFS